MLCQFALILSCAPPPPPEHAAAPFDTNEVSPRSGIRVTHEKDFEHHAEVIEDTIESEIKERLSEVSIDPNLALSVKIHVIAVGNYDVVVFAEGDHLPSHEPSTLHCKSCLPDELAAKVNQAIDAQLQAIAPSDEVITSSTTTKPREIAQPSHASNGGEVSIERHGEPLERPTTNQDPKPDRLSATGKAGAAILGTVVVPLGVAIGLVVAGVRVDQRDELATKDFRPGGYASFAVSGVMLLTGGIMLGLDLRKTRRGRRAAIPSTVPPTSRAMISVRF